MLKSHIFGIMEKSKNVWKSSFKIRDITFVWVKKVGGSISPGITSIRQAAAPTNARLERYFDSLPGCVDWKHATTADVFEGRLQKAVVSLKR